MLKRSSKRKQRDARARHPSQVAQWDQPETTVTEPDPSLFIQAYEADIVRGPQAWSSASSLEVGGVTDPRSTGLLRWNPLGLTSDINAEGDEGVWVDRYARHELPPPHDLVYVFLVYVCSRVHETHRHFER